MTCMRQAATGRRIPHVGMRGFTLIEIMIVVLIIGVLMAIAYPAYQNNVIRSRRATASGCLLERAQFMERFYTTNLTYVGADANPPACSSDLSRFYTIGPDGLLDVKTYTLQAVPTTVQRDPLCATIKINQAGVKTTTGTASNVRDCF